jgi:hypothetical protein
MSDTATLRDLADRREIHDLVLGYCRAVDRLDYAGIRAVYTEDGVDHHTGFSGSADEFVAWLRRLLPRLDGTMHVVGNHLCELAGDEAVAETYGTAVHSGTPGDHPGLNFTSGFRYLDHVVRTPEGWRVRERTAVREWTRSDAGRLITKEGEGPTGRRDAEDPLYALRQRVLGR